MFKAQKEIIWHLSCNDCGFYWTMPTMSEKLDVEKTKYTCPICAKSGNAKEVKNPS